MLVLVSTTAVAVVFAACKKEESAANPPAPAHVPSASEAAADQLPSPTTASNIVINAPRPAAISNAAPTAEAQVYDAAEAKNHVDETATVKGKVFGVHTTAKGDTFINVGAAYPGAPFAAVHFHSDETITTNDLAALDGKTVLFSGKIKEHNGQAEIVVTKAEQIKFDDGSAFTATGTAGGGGTNAAPADDRGN
jgi:hypothetical protein